MGGLETLTLTLIQVSSNATQSPLACELSCIMAKTLSACISDNREPYTNTQHTHTTQAIYGM